MILIKSLTKKLFPKNKSIIGVSSSFLPDQISPNLSAQKQKEEDVMSLAKEENSFSEEEKMTEDLNDDGNIAVD